ncbi:N(alpha)-acetyltransferase 20, NatB catalytic subunit [Physocladia obscura]|uniref:N(Alpha)-acetyltransferase 20, NatB catalytic subunit n=1 Tax=Physocladia obscura TaxID=109957 RepID=A0AAD5T106_9FUNG|nr:N(alpha)-acetyltransferase 20, NatB catalytic subunit [Physocladia obscura]
MGKAEGEGELWHGHVTALTVAPEYRRMNLANRLMNVLETVSEKIYNAYFVDLFVRESNSVAIGMYKGFGYSIYRTVLGYYSGGGGVDEENAYGEAFICYPSYKYLITRFLEDMRKALPRDVLKKSVIPMTRPIKPEELEW